MARDLQVNVLAPSEKFEAGVKRMEASARALHASELRLIAAEERLEKLRTTGKASAGQLATAQASVISAQDKVAKATGSAADVTERAGKRSSSAFGKVAHAASAMKGGVALAAAAGGAAVVAFAKQTVDAATDLQEQMSATKTLFQDAADEVIAFGESASSIGISTRAALEASNTFGDLFTKLGYTHEAAATFSEDLVRISADFASFKNMAPEEVLDKLRSGLAGESEPLRALGVFLTEAKVKAEAMRLGLADAHGELDDGAKVAARYSLIIASMGEAYGDVERTSDSYANTQRRFNAEMENLKATVGEGLLPVLTDLTTIATNVAKSLGEVEENDGGWTSKVEGWLDVLDVWEHIPGALDKMAGGEEKVAESGDYAADSLAALADEQARVREGAEMSTKAMEEQAKALDDLLQATVAQFDSEVAYQRAILGVQGDLEKYSEALALNKDGKADNDVSARELEEQELGLKDAILGAAAAAVKQAEDNAAAAGKTLTESEKYDLFRAALVKLKEQFPELAGEIDGYVARLKEVPPQKATTVILITEQAEAALSKWERRFAREHTARYNITASVSGGDGEGEGQPRGVKAMMAALPAGTRLISGLRPGAITATGNPSYHGMGRAVDIPPSRQLFEYIRARWPQSKELIYSPMGGRQIRNGRPHTYTGVTRANHFDHVHWALAKGGGVHGPGTGTSDSIVARLSNGEHVWTAAEVAKAGGHRAVEQMRKAVLGFATGGPVGRASVQTILAGGAAAINLKGLSDAIVDGLKRAGWTGRAGDNAERLYRPAPRPAYYGRSLTQATAGLTDPDRIREVAAAWEDYNRRLERNRALLADAQAAQYELKVAKSAEARAEAQKKVAAAQKAISEQQAEDRLDRERAAVDKLVESLEAQARAREEQLDLLNRYLDQEQSARDKGVQAERQYAERVAAIQQRSAEAGVELARQQQRLLDDRRDQLDGWARLDQRASVSWGNSVEQLLSNARDQAAQFEEWMSSLADARRRGVSEQVIAALGLDEGPQALGQLRQFGQATAAEIDALNAEVARRTALAGEQVSREQQAGYGDLGAALTAAHEDYTRALAGLNEELVQAQADLLVQQAEVATELAAIGQDQARSYGQALEQGLRSQIPAVLAAAQALQGAARGLAPAANLAGGDSSPWRRPGGVQERPLTTGGGGGVTINVNGTVLGVDQLHQTIRGGVQAALTEQRTAFSVTGRR